MNGKRGGLFDNPPFDSLAVALDQGVTTSITLFWWNAPLPLAFMNIWYVPGVVPGEDVRVSVELPELPGMVVELKDAVTPFGMPLAANERSPAPPLSGAAVTTKAALPEPDAETEACDGETVPLKSPPLLLTPR